MKVLAFLAVLVTAATATASPVPLRTRLMPSLTACEVWIIDREQGPGQEWSATKYHGGSHWRPGSSFDEGLSYGLPQAYPGSKMSSAGADWRTNPWTQIRWMRGYISGRYGSCSSAQAFWRANGWY